MWQRVVLRRASLSLVSPSGNTPSSFFSSSSLSLPRRQIDQDASFYFDDPRPQKNNNKKPKKEWSPLHDSDNSGGRKKGRKGGREPPLPFNRAPPNTTNTNNDPSIPHNKYPNNINHNYNQKREGGKTPPSPPPSFSLSSPPPLSAYVKGQVPLPSWVTEDPEFTTHPTPPHLTYKQRQHQRKLQEFVPLYNPPPSPSSSSSSSSSRSKKLLGAGKKKKVALLGGGEGEELLGERGLPPHLLSEQKELCAKILDLESKMASSSSFSPLSSSSSSPSSSPSSPLFGGPSLSSASLLVEVEGVLREMKEKGVPLTSTAFSALHSIYLSQGQINKAHSLFLDSFSSPSSLLQGSKTTDFGNTFNNHLSALHKKRHFLQMKETLEIMNTHKKIKVAQHIFHQMIQLFSKFGDMDAAFQVFNQMSADYQPKDESFTLIIQGLINHRGVEEAAMVMEQMEKGKLSPPLSALEALLYAYSMNRDKEGMAIMMEVIQKRQGPNESSSVGSLAVYDSIAAFYGANGDVEKVRETAELMKKERGKVSEGVRSSVVVGLCKEGRWREGLAEVMGEAEGGGVGGGRVKGYAWARVLRELGERGEERESERVLKRMKKLKMKMSANFYSPLINYFLNNQQTDKATKWLGEVKRECEKNGKYYTLLANYEEKSGTFDSVKSVFEEAHASGCHLPPSLSLSLAKSALKDGDLMKGVSVLHYLHEKKIAPPPELFNYLLNSSQKKKEREIGEMIWKAREALGVEMTPYCYTALANFALTMDLPDLLIGLLQKTAKSSICPPSDLISEVVAVIDTQDSSDLLPPVFRKHKELGPSPLLLLFKKMSKTGSLSPSLSFSLLSQSLREGWWEEDHQPGEEVEGEEWEGEKEGEEEVLNQLVGFVVRELRRGGMEEGVREGGRELVEELVGKGMGLYPANLRLLESMGVNVSQVRQILV